MFFINRTQTIYGAGFDKKSLLNLSKDWKQIQQNY